jgi:hypothetical protein
VAEVHHHIEQLEAELSQLRGTTGDSSDAPWRSSDAPSGNPMDRSMDRRELEGHHSIDKQYGYDGVKQKKTFICRENIHSKTTMRDIRTGIQRITKCAVMVIVGGSPIPSWFDLPAHPSLKWMTDESAKITVR